MSTLYTPGTMIFKLREQFLKFFSGLGKPMRQHLLTLAFSILALNGFQVNILRKAALNLVKSYQIESAPKRPLSRIMFDCLLNPEHLLEIIPRGSKEGCAK